MVDANCKFSIIEVGGYGKQCDGGTFASSMLYKMKNSRELKFPEDTALPNTAFVMLYVILADEAYPIKIPRQ